MRFIVRRREIWTQEVEVDAETETEALLKVLVGEGEIREDPRFRHLTDIASWEIKKSE